MNDVLKDFGSSGAVHAPNPLAHPMADAIRSECISLLKKTKDLFVERKICTVEDPTAFVLTVFDDPGFKIKQLENRILNNVIFKPFDRLILIQHLTNAIDGRHPPSKYTITK